MSEVVSKLSVEFCVCSISNGAPSLSWKPEILLLIEIQKLVIPTWIGTVVS